MASEVGSGIAVGSIAKSENDVTPVAVSVWLVRFCVVGT